MPVDPQPTPQEQDFDAHARRSVDMNDAESLRYWTERFGVSEEELRAAVEQVGPSPEAVAKRLERNWLP